MDDTCVPWLILIRAPALGPATLQKLLAIYQTPEQVLSASVADLAGHGVKAEIIRHLKKQTAAGYGDDIHWLKQPGHRLITLDDPHYPACLKAIHAAPVALFVQGDPGLLATPQIAIVGSRNPTRGGRETAAMFATELSGLGFTITSGLALGIDYCGHAATLAANGKTIAILGNGPDIIYPARHRKIGREIAMTGVLVSEFPPGVSPVAANFPRRNRIISGLSLGVLVVEAALQSGSLITARYAIEQGREVFAIPGSIHNPCARGCHYLIKQGAKLTENVEDILEELNVRVVMPVGKKTESGSDTCNLIKLDDDCQKLLDHISFDPIPVDKLIHLTGLTADAVSSMLLSLEVQGVVSSRGGLYCRIT